MTVQTRITHCVLLLLSFSHLAVRALSVIETESLDNALQRLEEDRGGFEDEEEERLFVIPAVTLNISSLATALPIALALATSFASLMATAALAAVVFSLFAKYKYDGYGGYGGNSYGGGHTGGYTSYGTSSYRALFDPNMINWEKYSILDLVSVGEEIWQKFDPSDIHCQKRLVCDIHQNAYVLGFAARKIVDIFGYLTYAKVVNLPEELDVLVDEYLDAAEKGMTKDRDCGEMFPDCKFSLKKIAKKYGSNEI